METWRLGTFETNSSSSHVLTIGKKLRPIGEFPVPDADGVINVEIVRTDWGCIDFAPSPKTFNEFLILGIGMMAKGYDPRTRCPSKNDQIKFIKWINIVYKMVGLPEVKAVRMSWSTALEIRQNGQGNLSDSWVNMTDGFQNNGLEGFLNSLAYALPDTPMAWMDKALEPINEDDYHNDVLLHNAALAVVCNSTGEIEEN
jgi:hypothetical protein